MIYNNGDIGRSLQEVVGIIRAGGVLIADVPPGLNPDRPNFNLSVGPYLTACQAPAYAFYCNTRQHIYKSPLHAAQAFQGALGYKAAQQAIAKYREDN